MKRNKDQAHEARVSPNLLESGHLNTIMTRVGRAYISSGNKVKILENGEETYKDWLNAIDKARKWIHLENYIIQDDKIGKIFAEHLIRKSHEGVKIRVLYDWFGCFGTPKSYWKNLRENGIEVRCVSPFKIFYPLKVFTRDHRKYLGIDGIYSSAGGLCIGDQWLEKSEDGIPFRDTALRIEGPAIVDFEEGFAKLWNSLGEELPNEERISKLSFPEIKGDESIRVILQEPGKTKISKILELMIASSKEKLWIADAYFLAIPSLYKALIYAAKDGVDVRILLPQTNDIAWIASISRTGYRQLLRAGVRIWEYSGPMMHSKTTVVDGWWSRVGSTNLNISSLLLNWELDMIIEDRSFGEDMEKMYLNDLDDAVEIFLDKRDYKKFIEENSQNRESSRFRKRKIRGSGSKGFLSIASRVGSVVAKKSGSALRQHERKVSGIVTFILFALSLILFLFPKVLSWFIGSILLIISAIGFYRLFQPVKEELVDDVF